MMLHNTLTPLLTHLPPSPAALYHQLTPNSPTHTSLDNSHPTHQTTPHSPTHTPLTNPHPTRQLTPHSPNHTPLTKPHPIHKPTVWVPHTLTVTGCGVESSQDTTLITSTCGARRARARSYVRMCVHRSLSSRGGGVVSAICQL